MGKFIFKKNDGYILIYIIVAFKMEAKPLIDYFKLQKQEDKNFLIYQNDKIKLIVSGVGKINSAIATTYILQNSTKDSIVFNIGLCAGQKVGNIYLINEVVDYNTNIKKKLHIDFEHNFKTMTLTTFDVPVSSWHKTLVDMEGIGFYLSASKFINTNKIFIIKIVSDNFKAKFLKKSFINSLFLPHIKAIDNLIVSLL